MKVNFHASRFSRILVTSLAILNAVEAVPRFSQAQEKPGSSQLRIVILEGDGAINNLRQRTAREPIVQVEDENRKPVAGAMVLFTLPNSGPGAVFADGSKTLIAYTDEKGQARAKGIKPNSTVGAYQIVVNATAHGLKASAVLSQSNVLTAAVAAGGISAKLIAILAIAGGAAAAGAIAATSGGNNSTPTPVPTATVTAGTATVGGPN